MNLRPLGYEPNELPDCSTPQNHPSARGPSGQWGIRLVAWPRRVAVPVMAFADESRKPGIPLGSDFCVWHNMQGVVRVLTATREG